MYSDTTDNGNKLSITSDPTGNILNTAGVVDPHTGRVLTVAEAIHMQILDVRTGEIVIGSERISLEEAVKRKLIDATLANNLLRPGAAIHAGRPISLLEVIQKEISDAENGYDSTEKRIKVITTTTKANIDTGDDDMVDVDGTKQHTIAEAIESGIVDAKSGLYRTKTGQLIAISEAVRRGYLIQSETVKIKSNELCLSDAIVHGLVDTSGWITDRNSGDKFRLDSAIGNGLITPHVREVVDAKSDVKITLQQALDAGILNAKTGRYMQNVTKEKLTFTEAKSRQLVGKPMTLKDVVDLNLLEKNGRIISPTRKSKLNVIEAIHSGVLDSDEVKSIAKTKDERLTLTEALAEGIILPQGIYRDAVTQEEISIPEAVERGLISSVSQRTIFNIDGFKDPHSTDFVSVNVALAKNMLVKREGEFHLDVGKGQFMPLSNGVESGLVRPEIYEMLTRPMGVFDASGKQLSVLDLVYYDLIDPKSGYLLHPKTKAIVPLDHAIESKMITPEGALLLSSLLNITLTTETVTKTIRRYVTITEDDPNSQVEQVPTFTEAVRLGYIDERRQLYTDPSSGKIYSVQQALNHRLVLPDSNSEEIPLPAKRSTITIVHKSFMPQLNETIERTKTVETAVPTVAAKVVATPEYTSIHTETKVEKKRDTKTVTSDFLNVEQRAIPLHAVEQYLEVPPEGWALATAIEKRLFDPITGLFHIAATDRLVSFEECIQLEIINPASVSVVDPSNGRKTTVKRAFEKRILDATGNYKKNKKLIGMKQAIESNLIILERPPQESVEVVRTVTHATQDIPSPEPIQLIPGVIYDPSTALVIFTESGRSENVVKAATEGLIDPQLIKVTDPKTGWQLNVTEAVDRGIVNRETGDFTVDPKQKLNLMSAVKMGLLTVVGTPLVAAAGAYQALKLVIDPKTGREIPIEVAYERGLVTKEQLMLAYADSPSKARELEQAIHHTTITVRTPERENLKPVILQKMRKKIVHPKDALEKGLIDAKTAELLDARESFIDQSGELQSLGDAVQAGKIAGDKGKIVDPQRGDSLTINQAIERGVLDADGTNQLLVPLNKSLSIVELKHQGLIDPTSLKIIHPETGVALSLREAIVCEIVDPMSTIVDPFERKSVTLAQAIEKGVVDDERNLIATPSGKVDLLVAIKQKLCRDDAPHKRKVSLDEMPPLGMTLPVAVKRGLIDAATKEFIHPITGERTPLTHAIEENLIMALPYTPNVDSVSVEEALAGDLIDVAAGTMRSPKTNEIVTIAEAVDNGLLVVKPLPELIALHASGPVTSVTETVTSYHTITTKTVELLSGYVLVSPTEVKHVQTGQIISVAEAKQKGIIKDESQSSEQFATREIKVNFSDAIRRGLVDIKAGTYTDPRSGAIMPIQQAVDEGILETDEASDTDSEPLAVAEKPKPSKTTGSKIASAAKTGLLAVVGAPVLAGMAVADVVKKATKKKEKPTPSERTKPRIVETPPEQTGSVVTTKTTTITTTVPPATEEKRIEIVKPVISENVTIETVSTIKSEVPQYPDVVDEDQLQVPAELHITETLTPERLEQFGIFNTETETFVHPETQERIPFYSVIYDLNIFDPSKIYVKDLSNDVYEPFEVALEKPLIDKNTGHMVDSKSGQRVPFFECVQRRWILESIPEEEEPDDLSPINELVEIVLEPKRVDEEIKTGSIRIERLLIKDPVSKELLPMQLAVERGIVDLRRGVIVNATTNETTDFSKACEDGSLIAGKQPPVALEALVRQGLYDADKGVVYDLARRNQYTIIEAIEHNIIRSDITMIRTDKGESIPLDDALNKQLVLYTGHVVHKNKQVPLNVALEQGLLFTRPIHWELLDVLIKQYYSRKTKTFLNPVTGEQNTLGEALSIGWIDGSSVLVKDERVDDAIPLHDAIRTGLVDTTRGVVTKPQLALDDALSKGYLISANKPYSLVDLIIRHLYDPATGLLTIDGVQLSLENALKEGLVHTQDMVVKDPRNGEIITLLEAIRRGIVDPRTGIAIDPRSGLKLTLIDAYETGILIQSKRKCSLPDAVFKGIYDPKSGKFSTSVAAEKMSTERAIRRGIIDAHSTIVNVKGRVLPFELAAESGIVDVRRGTVVDDYDNKIDFREAFDRGILIEVKKPISLCEALLKGLYDESTGLFMDPKTGKRLTITQSLSRNLIDPHSVQMKDPTTGQYKAISLLEATETGLINGQNAQILNGSIRITLKEAFDLGLLTDTNAPISIQRAIHQGLYDDKTGKIHDSKSGRKITVLEAIRKFVINPQLPCYFDPHDERLLSLSETCRAQLIDRREGVFKEPSSDVFIPLGEAMAIGLIVDIENGSFGLYETIAMRLYDRQTKQIIHPVTGQKLSLQQACEQDLVNPISSLVKDTVSGNYMKLNDAVDAHIIDELNGLYKLPKYVIDLHEARKRGLIVSNRNQLSIADAVRMQLVRFESGKFVDPSTNKNHDLHHAIEIYLIDPETTVFKNIVTGQYKPLKQAIDEGDIDVARGRVIDPKSRQAHTFDVALEKGLLVTIDRPVSRRSSKRRDSIDLQMSPLKGPREMSLQAAIEHGLINPESAVVKDLATGKFKALKHSIEHVDTAKRAVVDPNALYHVFDKTLIIYVREPLSFDYAVESNQLDLDTGKFTDPQDPNKTYSLKAAIELGLIDPESALIKDGAKRKLLRLPEAYRKGLLDAEKANVLDTSTSKLCPLHVAYETGLLITPKRSFGILEAISYQLYQPKSGTFVDPFVVVTTETTKITLNDAIASGLIDPTTTVVRDTENSTIVPLTAAIALGSIDPIEGRLVKSDSEKIDFVKAYEKGYILAAEQRVSLSMSMHHPIYICALTTISDYLQTQFFTSIQFPCLILFSRFIHFTQ